MTFTKLNQSDFDCSRIEFSNCDPGIAVALSIFFRNYFFVCLYWGSDSVVTTAP